MAKNNVEGCKLVTLEITVALVFVPNSVLFPLYQSYNVVEALFYKEGQKLSSAVSKNL